MQGHIRPDLSGFKADHFVFSHNQLKSQTLENGTAVALSTGVGDNRMGDHVP